MNPSVVILSGSLSRGSASNRLATWCAERCAPHTETTVFHGHQLEFPFYTPGLADSATVRPYLDALTAADGVIVISPAYHGSISGLLKNALDYINELSTDTRPYLQGRVFGCVAVAGGEQGAASTLAALRAISHALRAWPTPLGVGIARPPFTTDGLPADATVAQHLPAMLNQVLEMSRALNHKEQPLPVGSQ
ncbi:NADPH-dependent FMN reductase [Nocardia sp. NPDC055053]